MKQALSTNDTSVWQAYRTSLYHFVRTRVVEPADAEDIVQDVLVKAYTALATLKDDTKLRPWLYQIARNAIIDFYRQHQPLAALSDALPVVAATMDESNEVEFAQCLTPLIAQLPPDYRQAIILAELQGLTQQAVATAQGLSLSGAKSRVQRGRKLLKALFLQCCQVELDRRGGIIDCQTQTQDAQCHCA
ncbi:MAG: RNA polymerase sigma factor SigZ [Caldilineaceae bacterium]